jgi:hypothetical protein
MEMYGKYNNEEERNNDRSEGRFLNKKKAVAKKMGQNKGNEHKKFMNSLHIGGLNPYYKGSKDYRKAMKDMGK